VTPRVSIHVVDVARSGTAWKVRWRLASEPPIRLTHAAAPHGKFRAEDRDIDLLTPAELSLEVTSSEPPGAEIENTFLILTADVAGDTRRILARMRVRVGDDGTPRPTVERIDVQEVGFDGQR
jgi:hypothetical protein